VEFYVVALGPPWSLNLGGIRTIGCTKSHQDVSLAWLEVKKVSAISLHN